MVFAFYRKARGAQSERELDEAADLFADPTDAMLDMNTLLATLHKAARRLRGSLLNPDGTRHKPAPRNYGQIIG